jgi:tetratricopeptide (TPR) repeat protein
MATPEPIATGNLAKTPLPHLLVYLDQKKLSGTLALWPDDLESTVGQDRVLFLKGRPVAARLMQNAATLREGLVPLFARTRAPYAFYEGNLLGDDRVSGRIDPMASIMDALRAGHRLDIVEAVLGRFGNSKLRMQPGAELDRYELSAKERAIVELLQAEPADVVSLVHASGLPEQLGRSILYALAISKALAPHVEGERARSERPPAAEASPRVSAPSAPPPAPNPSAPPPSSAGAGASGAPGSMHQRLDRLNSIPPPPDDLSDDHKARWSKIIAKGRLIENQNYFEMLEIDKEAKAADARNKFYQMAKEWHPDRLPQELQPLREYVQIIFSYMSEANTSLSDEAARLKYVQTVREGGGTPATDKLMQSILDNAMEYERVLVMTRRHQYDDALELLKRILNVVKDEPDYHAMYAWLLMQKKEAPLPKMLESVDAALALHPQHEKANMLKAQILRKMNKPTEALEYFKKVADQNPNNIEAVREVRVATMRGAEIRRKKRQEAESGPVDRLLGKLFKKK